MANKLNPIGFACLISKVAVMRGEELYASLVEDFSDLALNSVIEPVVQQPHTVLCSQIDALLEAIQKEQNIEAIKAYRSLTNSSLLDSKNAIEKYWYNHRLDV